MTEENKPEREKMLWEVFEKDPDAKPPEYIKELGAYVMRDDDGIIVGGGGISGPGEHHYFDKNTSLPKEAMMRFYTTPFELTEPVGPYTHESRVHYKLFDKYNNQIGNEGVLGANLGIGERDAEHKAEKQAHEFAKKHGFKIESTP